MEHKLILFGLFYALLQDSFLGVAKGADSAQDEDGPLIIYLDAGMEMESILSLAKKNEEKLSRMEKALATMSAKIEAFETRMAADIMQLTQNVLAKRPHISSPRKRPVSKTRLGQNVVTLSSQPTKRPLISTPRKRPAELACEAIENELRMIGVTQLSVMPTRYIRCYVSSTTAFICTGTIIDKRFVITTTNCLRNHTVTELSTDNCFRDWMAPGVVKKIHIQHPASSNGIALIELHGDVEYSTDVYPACLYTKKSNPENNLRDLNEKVKILSAPECLITTCVETAYNYCIWSGLPVFEVKENALTYRLFGMNPQTHCGDTYSIIKMFDHLDYIESIVWPKSGN